MSVRHKNEYGYWEEVDRLPIPGCSCSKCSRAADRDAERQSRRSQRRRDVGKAAEAAVTIVTAFNGLIAEPPVDQVYNAGDAYDQSRSSRVDKRDEYLDEQTRAANDRKGGSSRRR